MLFYVVNIHDYTNTDGDTGVFNDPEYDILSRVLRQHIVTNKQGSKLLTTTAVFEAYAGKTRYNETKTETETIKDLKDFYAKVKELDDEIKKIK